MPFDQYAGGTTFSYAYPGEVIAAGAVLPSLCIIIVALRFWTRSLQKGNYGVDDWLTLPALLMIIGMGAGLIAGVKLGAMAYPTPPSSGGHDAIQGDAVTITEQVEFAVNAMMVVSLGLTKLSIIFFCRRIFSTKQRRLFDIITYGLIALISTWTLVFLLFYVFPCGSRFAALWTSLESLATECLHTLLINEALVISDFITDVMIIALPIPLVWALQMTRPRKLAITGVFLLGGIALAASVTRLVIYVEVINRGLDPTEDLDMVVTTVLYWSFLEASLALTAACLPTLSSLVSKKGLQSAVNSVRSAISLHSLGSSHHRESRVDVGPDYRKDSYQNIESIHSKDEAAQAQLTHPEGSSLQNHVTHDEELGLMPPMPAAIRITHSVSQSSDIV